MMTIRIQDKNAHALSFDLRHILNAIKRSAESAFWEVGEVAQYQEPLFATGSGADRLDDLAVSGVRVAGAVLREIACETHQVIWGEFRGYDRYDSQESRITIRAIDSSFYEVVTDDASILRRLRARFADICTA